MDRITPKLAGRVVPLGLVMSKLLNMANLNCLYFFWFVLSLTNLQPPRS